MVHVPAIGSLVTNRCIHPCAQAALRRRLMTPGADVSAGAGAGGAAAFPFLGTFPFFEGFDLALGALGAAGAVAFLGGDVAPSVPRCLHRFFGQEKQVLRPSFSPFLSQKIHEIKWLFISKKQTSKSTSLQKVILKRVGKLSQRIHSNAEDSPPRIL